MSSSVKEAFLPVDYKTVEAKTQVIQSNAASLEEFVKGLKQRKATVYSTIMTESISGFNGVVTLSSLLLQMNLFCRKHNSLQLLRQLKADELTRAILSFYDGSFTAMRDYSKFVKEIFACIQ